MSCISKCNIYIVDSDAPFRRSLVQELRDMGYAPTPYPTAEDFLEALDFLGSGIVMLSLQLSDADGEQVQASLRERRADMTVVMLARQADIRTAVRVMRGGACDLLEIPFAPGLLGQALEVAREDLASRVAEQSRRCDAMERLERLSPREMEVLTTLSREDSNALAAARLNLSPRTIEMHRASIIRKCGVHRFTQVLMLARDAGLS